MSEDVTGGSIADVAREAGVSRSTVSRAMRGDHNVLPETRRKVLEAAERIGYQPNAMARLFRTGDRRTFGLVLTPTQLSRDLYIHAIDALSRTLRQKQLRLTISVVHGENDAETAIREQLGWCTVLAVPRSLVKDPARLWCKDATIILLDCVPADGCDSARVNTVGFDQARGIASAVEHLASMGHRNIAYFGGVRGDPVYDLREQGFRAAMSDACLPIRSEWIFHCGPEHPSETAAAAFEQAIKVARCQLSGAVCASDEIALGVVASLRSLRREVPDDLSVTGYGGSEPACSGGAFLTTVEHRGQTLGDALAQFVQPDPDIVRSTPARVILPAELVVRDSTAPRSGHLRVAVPCATAGSPVISHRVSEARDVVPVLEDGMYELRARHSDMPLDVSNRTKTPGGTMCQTKVTGGPTQQWHLHHARDNWYTLRNAGTLLYLDADIRMPGVNVVIQNPRNDEVPDIQLWRFEPVGPGERVYRIVNKAKGLVLDVTEKSHLPATLVLVFPRSEEDLTENQQWNPLPIPFLTGVYELVAWHSSKALDLPPGPCHGRTVPFQSGRMRTLSQRWRLVHRGGGLYRIESLAADLLLQAGPSPQGPLKLARPEEEVNDSHTWRFELADKIELTYRIVSVANGLVLEIPQGQHASGAAAGMAKWTGQLHQEWLIYADEAPL